MRSFRRSWPSKCRASSCSRNGAQTSTRPTSRASKRRRRRRHIGTRGNGRWNEPEAVRNANARPSCDGRPFAGSGEEPIQVHGWEGQESAGTFERRKSERPPPAHSTARTGGLLPAQHPPLRIALTVTQCTERPPLLGGGAASGPE